MTSRSKAEPTTAWHKQETKRCKYTATSADGQRKLTCQRELGHAGPHYAGKALGEDTKPALLGSLRDSAARIRIMLEVGGFLVRVAREGGLTKDEFLRWLEGVWFTT